jgi:capsular polysaccharide export protein
MGCGLVHRRRFLFLQGMATWFFARLGAALAQRGHEVRRINFNGGDWLFWPLPGAVGYRGGLSRWPEFLVRRLGDWGVTDIVLFGDCRPLHVAAIEVAKAHGVSVHVFEEGYLRPNWVTLEQGGVNGKSTLPRDPTWFREAAIEIPAWDDGGTVIGRFRTRAVNDVLYHTARWLLAWRYPRYRSHLLWHPFVEYLGWLRRFALAPIVRRRTAEQLLRLNNSGSPYYLFPLQLDSDSQIRVHSPFAGMADALETVIGSFARHAPTEACLVIKEHPFDVGIVDLHRVTKRLAERLGVEDRVVYLRRGPLENLIAGCRSTVTVNSTSGLLALAAGRPVIALGASIYDTPQLTFQGGLDRFWREATPADTTTFDAFRRVVADRTQINGGFFSAEGLAMAVDGAVERLERAMVGRSLPRPAPRPSGRVAADIVRQRAPAVGS